MPANNAFVLARARVVRAERPSPSFARITLGGDDLHDLGNPGRTFDQRIKLILPGPSGVLPSLPGDDWYSAWRTLPENDRGTMRTYSIRQLCCEGTTTRLVVDVVLHPDSGPYGPGAAWASSAVAGSEVLVVGPRRGNVGGGIEFAPAGAASVTLAGDESAAPAIARILEDLDRDAVGTAFIEVPTAGDALPIDAPTGVDVRWLPRSGDAHGSALLPAVLRHVGVAPAPFATVEPDADPVWETPTYSGLGEPLQDTETQADRYYWIAGEASVVTTLRRHLVRDAGIHRSQVAFMGYWRIGRVSTT